MNYANKFANLIYFIILYNNTGFTMLVAARLALIRTLIILFFQEKSPQDTGSTLYNIKIFSTYANKNHETFVPWF